MLGHLKHHKFAIHSVALVLMLTSALALYFAARADAGTAEILLLATFALGAALTTWV